MPHYSGMIILPLWVLFLIVGSAVVVDLFVWTYAKKADKFNASLKRVLDTIKK